MPVLESRCLCLMLDGRLRRSFGRQEITVLLLEHVPASVVTVDGRSRNGRLVAFSEQVILFLKSDFPVIVYFLFMLRLKA